jgi:hypothetical protein
MVTVQLDDRIAAALRDQAQARGLTLEAYLRAIAEMLQYNVPAAINHGDAQEFDAALQELFAADTRPLPAVPLTYSREDIYFDHD